MNGAHRTATRLITALLLAAAVAYAGLVPPRPAFDPLAVLLFTALFLFTDALAIPVGVGYVNLAPTVAVAALLVQGPFVAALIALVGSAVNIGVRWAFPERVGEAREPGGLSTLIGIGLTNAFLLTASLTAGAAVYQAAGGPIPLNAFTPQFVGPYLLFLLVYAVVNYGLAAIYVMLPGDPALLHRFLRALPMMSTYEIVPQLLTPLLPLIYLGLGPVPFLMAAVGLATGSMAMRGLAVTGKRLERRVAELNTLGALSQALASSLQIEDLLATLREQLPRILPVGGLYVGLWDPDKEVVSFPLLLEKGRVAAWDPRQHGNGFSEHVIRTRQPLLLPENVTERAHELALDPPAVAASSWLVVPIIAGSQVLGVLGVYTLAPQGTRLTNTDRDLLITIATQLAVALHNARLYGKTDEALAQRVQQLSSILYTTGEGILLLDAGTHVLTANRALAGFVGLEVAELTGRALAADDDLLARLGTSRPQLETDLAALHSGADLVKHVHTSGTPAQRDLERTLAPVRASGGEVAGWLMILRDVSEEQALEQLRDDLTHMLVHDLRGPLGSILTSLALVQQMALPDQPLDPEANDVLSLAHSSGEHLMVMINQLLDVARIESGSVPLQRERVSPEELLSAAALRLRPAAEAAAIQLVAEAAPGLPELSVDTQLMGRVLDNLGDNAIKFSPNGSTVRLWARADGSPAAVLFGVSDEGPGIPHPAQSRLFEKFHRLPNIQGRRGGTGLGLAFCRLVIQAHGGEIWVESEVGQGSTFVVRLPVGESSTDGTDKKTR
jgi:PAS domain S-box-containing protein